MPGVCRIKTLFGVAVSAVVVVVLHGLYRYAMGPDHDYQRLAQVQAALFKSNQHKGIHRQTFKNGENGHKHHLRKKNMDEASTTFSSDIPLDDTKHPKSQRPNIVFILADDLGFNDVSYHNKKGVYTPTIDRLAREGVTLESYYVQPICSPSRIQFMSGRKLIHTGVVHNTLHFWQPYGLPLDSLTLADKLKEAGYATDMIGKWHLGYHEEAYLPTRRGFDTFYGYYLAKQDYFTHERCRDDVCRLDLHNDTVKERTLDDGKSGVYSTELYTDEAIRVIKKRSKGDNPFFMYLSYQAVHDPIQVPIEYQVEVKSKLGKVKIGNSRRKGFVGMAYAMDCGIARVVQSLKDSGAWNNTILIFSSDNGGVAKNGGSNLPLKGEKFTFYEGGVRAVGLVNSPLLEKTGYVNKEMIHITDWFKTFVTLAKGNLKGTRDVEGFDQWKTISKGSPSQRNEILFNIDPLAKTEVTPEFKHDFDTRLLAALRIGDYKIITGLKEAPGLALYNIAEDPLEKNDLSEKEEFRSKVIEMLDALQVHHKTSVPAVFPPDHVIDPKSKVIGPGIIL